MSALVINANPDIVTIPVDTTFPWYDFQIALSGTLYTLEFRYNVRAQRWVMNIGDPQGNVILAGIPLLVNRNPLARFGYIAAAPPGIFFVMANDGSDTQPGRYAWSTTHTLYYYDPLGLT